MGIIFSALFILIIQIDNRRQNTNENELVEKRAKIEVERLLESIQTDKKHSFIKANSKNVIYYILNTEEEKKEMINELEKQTKKAVSKVSGSKAFVLSYISEKEITEKVSHRLSITKSFLWNARKNDFELVSKKETVVEIMLTETRQAIRLQDLVRTEADLLAIHRIVQQSILSLNLKVENKIDKVLEMKRLTLDSEVRILPRYLEVQLDENLFGISKIDIVYSEIFHFIDSSIIDNIEAPKKYLEEGKKYLALTFDDGPNESSTARLLDILKKEETKATFFVLGNMVEANPEIAQRIVQENHEIASHSFSHPDLTSLTLDQVRSEVSKTDKVIYDNTNVLPINFRPPYGAINKQVAREIGLPIIQWNTDSQDWKLRDRKHIITEVIDSAQHGSIILLHDIHDTTIDAVPEIIHRLRSQGYEFVTVHNLLSGMQKPLSQYFGKTDERLIE